MPTADEGNQTVVIKEGTRFDPEDMNKLLHDYLPYGVYAGWGLSIVDDDTAQIATGSGVLNDSSANQAVKVITEATIDIDVTPSTSFIVVEWQFEDNEEQNYADFQAVGSPSGDQIVIGEATFDVNDDLDGFDLSQKDTIDTDALKAGPENSVLVTQSNDVQWDVSPVLDEGLVVNESGADSDTRVEGSSDANLLFVDASTDRIGIGTNTPSVKLHVSGSMEVSSSMEVGGNVEFNQNELLQPVIDKLSSDPGSPVIGQIWYRTDLD